MQLLSNRKTRYAYLIYESRAVDVLKIMNPILDREQLYIAKQIIYVTIKSYHIMAIQAFKERVDELGLRTFEAGLKEY